MSTPAHLLAVYIESAEPDVSFLTATAGQVISSLSKMLLCTEIAYLVGYHGSLP